MFRFFLSEAVLLDTATTFLARFWLTSLASTAAGVIELKRSYTPFLGFIFSGAFAAVPVPLGYYSPALSLQCMDSGKSTLLCSLAVFIVLLLANIFQKLQVDEDVISDSASATRRTPFLSIVGVSLLKRFEHFPSNVGDAWVLVQAVGFAMRFMLNEIDSLRYLGYFLTIFVLQLSVMGFATFFMISFDMTTDVSSLTSVLEAIGFYTIPS